MPNIAETYVHRIGRTGRAGAKGTALSFCDAEEKEYLRDIEKLIAKKIPVIDDHSFPLMDHNPLKAPKQQGRGNSGHPGPKPPAKSTSKRWAEKPRSGR